MKDPDFLREYDALEEEFALILEVAKARQRARLGRAEVARRMKTTRRTLTKLANGRPPSAYARPLRESERAEDQLRAGEGEASQRINACRMG